jgi:opacity protein-like surface antigen
MKSYLGALGAVLLMGGSAPLLAQTYEVYPAARQFQWHVDAGGAITTGRTADFLDSGWTIGTGFTWHPQLGSPFALRTDLHYSRFNATNQLITLGEIANQTQIDDGSGQIVALDLNAVFETPVSRNVRAYVIGGVGVDYRKIELTQTVAVGGVVCDGWWGFCGFGYVPGDVLIQREETTRLAWNAGVGLDFALGHGQSWFIEARFNRMETHDPTDFVPIRVGMRF